jgi:hypothetical protein
MDLTLTYWVVAAVLLHNVVAWGMKALAVRQSLAATLRQRVARWPWVWPGLREIGRFLFYIGIPYLALVQGVVSARTMGLSGMPSSATQTGPATLVGSLLALDWARSLGVGSLLALGAFAVVALSWWRYQRLVGKLPTRSWHFQAPEDQASAAPAMRWPLGASLTALRQPWGWARLLLDAVYLEVHWAFYRAWTLELLHDNPVGMPMGAFLGLILVGLEWYGDVGLRERLRAQAGVEDWAFIASLAFVSTFLFLFIGNLWVLIAAHWLVAWGVLAFLGWLRRRDTIPARTRV